MKTAVLIITGIIVLAYVIAAIIVCCGGVKMADKHYKKISK